MHKIILNNILTNNINDCYKRKGLNVFIFCLYCVFNFSFLIRKILNLYDNIKPIDMIYIIFQHVHK